MKQIKKTKAAFAKQRPDEKPKKVKAKLNDKPIIKQVNLEQDNKSC